MFSFMKKSGSSGGTAGAGGNSDQDDKERRKQDKKDRKKKDRVNMSAEDLLRLDEIRKSLKLTGKRLKGKEKLPSGITADYTADFLASLDRLDTTPPIHSNQQQQSDSSETSLNSLTCQQNSPGIPPTIPPKPPKRGILKTARLVVTTASVGGGLSNGGGALNSNTLMNEVGVITYENVPPHGPGRMAGGLYVSMGTGGGMTSPSADSLTDTSNSTSFITPPFSLSPVGESEGLLWSTRSNNAHHHQLLSATEDKLQTLHPLPPITALKLPAPRTLILARNPPPRADFGFSLRRAMVLLRGESSGAENSIGEVEGGASSESMSVTMRAVIFAEPSATVGASVANGNTAALLPGDKLLEVNGVKVEGKSREDIIEMIKASGDTVTLKVQPVAELSELTRRHGHDGQEIVLDEANIKSGTLRRSGSRRFNPNTTGKTDEELSKEQLWLDSERLWLVHRAGFTLTRRLPANSQATIQESHGKVLIQVEQTEETLTVDEDDLEPANPTQFDRVEDLTTLRHLNESSVLHTIRQRYASNLIHTYAGPSTLIVANPVAPLAIYSEKVISLFRGCKAEDCPPHIYSTAQSAYHALRTTRRDQTIVLLGRSGSGKTSNFRHCVQYLVTACSPAITNSAGGRPVALNAEKLTAVWQIVEAFGNAKTCLNQNASRFTQLFTLDFDQNGLICSASLQVLLFERYRIVKHLSNDETSFHIVNRLLFGAEGALRRELYLDQLTTDGVYAASNSTSKTAGEDRQRAQAEFSKVMSALQVLGASAAEQRLIWIILAAALHLRAAGCVKAATTTPTITLNSGTNNTLRYQWVRPALAQRAAYLLGVSADDLTRHVFSSSDALLPPVVGGGQQLGGGKGVGEGAVGAGVDGQEQLDAMVVALYVEVWNCVTGIVNRSISATTPTSSTNPTSTSTLTPSIVASINLFDLPGIQNPASVNAIPDPSISQPTGDLDTLCWNYVQERIHALYGQVSIRVPRERYQQEGVGLDGVEGEGEGVERERQRVVGALDRQPVHTSMLRSSYSDLSSSHTSLLSSHSAGGAVLTPPSGVFWQLEEAAFSANNSSASSTSLNSSSSNLQAGSQHADEQLLQRILSQYAQQHNNNSSSGASTYNDVIRPGPVHGGFIVGHLAGTSPVLYSVLGWLRMIRISAVTTARANPALTLLQHSSREDLHRLISLGRTLGAYNVGALGNIMGGLYEGGAAAAHSLRRASSVRRTFTAGASGGALGGAKRRSSIVQTKFVVDGLIETLRRSKLHFVYCLLPQHNAATGNTGDILNVTSTEALINIPLLRSQMRGLDIVDAARLHKQGFPLNMALGEFRRRFGLLATPSSSGSSLTNGVAVVTSGTDDDERLATETLAEKLELDGSSYRIGASQIFLRSATISQLESARDHRLHDTIVRLQAAARGLLARRRLHQLRLQAVAVRCIQRNVRKHQLVRHWPWWKLLLQLQPLLNVNRVEEELKTKTEELQTAKSKLEKIEADRNYLKLENDKLETKRATRSRTPLLHSCTSRSPSPLVARRVYPQYAPNSNVTGSGLNAANIGDDLVDGGRDPSPIVIDAKLGFIVGTKCQLRQTLSPIPAHLEDSTASSYLSSKIADFLTRTDHVMDEWRRIGGRDSCSSGPPGRLGRSRSATNIMIRGFQYYSRANSLATRSRSRTREISEEQDTTIGDDRGDYTELDEISEITADLADEHSAATLASERLEAESADRLRLERELTEAQVRNERLERTGERLEMELLYARADLNGGGAGSSIVSEDGSSSVGGDDEEGANGDGYYKERYQRAVRELQFTKRRLQQQHEDDLEQLVGLKKQLEKKLSDAHEETSEQRAASAQWKRRVAKVTGELTDVKLLLEQQMSRNSLLEKKQRKFDAELQAGAEVLRSEKTVKDRLQRELDEARRRELELEGDLEEAKHELEVQTERLREADASSCMVLGSVSEDETSQLRRLRVEHERRLQEQEQELDELAGQVQLLEAAKLRLEMALEQQRKLSKREAAQHEEELEEARCHGQKKVKVLEQQLEAEQAERSNLIHQKREAERRLTALLERQREESHREESASNRLKRDLKRTKALLRDAHAQLQSRTAGTDRHKAQVRQLRNQLDEAEIGRASAVKAKSAALDEVAEKEAQLDEAARGRKDAEEGLSMLQREHQANLARLEENEEELSSLLQRHRSALASQTRDYQTTLRDKESMISELESERSQLREQLHELNTRLEAALTGGAGAGASGSAGLLDGNVQRLLETRAREADTRLELEQTVRARLEVQVNRAKEAAERSAQEAHHARNNQQQAQEQLRKVQRTMREVREDTAASVARETETAVKIREAETRAETATSEAEALRTDLRLALQRIDALQQAMSADLDDLDDNSNSDQDDDNSDDDSSLDDLYLTTSKSVSSSRLGKGASVGSSASTVVGSSGSGSTITTLQNGNAVSR